MKHKYGPGITQPNIKMLTKDFASELKEKKAKKVQKIKNYHLSSLSLVSFVLLNINGLKIDQLHPSWITILIRPLNQFAPPVGRKVHVI